VTDAPPQPNSGSGDARNGSRRVRELDAIRGIAALVVVVHHVFLVFQAEMRTALNPWIYEAVNVLQGYNKEAVLLFFVLSGYSIGLSTAKTPPSSWQRTRDYLIRRAKRILPLYYLSFAWTFLLGCIYGLDRPSFQVSTLLGNMAFLQTSASSKGNWFEPYGDNGPYWSLSYEVFFYAVLPGALSALNSSARGRSSPDQMIFVAIGASLLGLAFNQVMPSPFSQFLTLWIVWVLGFISVNLPRSPRHLMLLASPFLLFATLWASLASLDLKSDTLVMLAKGCLLALIFGSIATYSECISGKAMLLVRWILIRLFAHVGDGSYALYLLHYPLLLALDEVLGAFTGWWLWSMMAVGLLLFVSLVCPYIESRSTDLWRKRRIQSTAG